MLFCCLLLLFFKINFIKKFFLVFHQSVKKSVGHDLDPNCLTVTLMVFLKEFFERDDFEKKLQTTKLRKNCPAYKELNPLTVKVNLGLIVGD